MSIFKQEKTIDISVVSIGPLVMGGANATDKADRRLVCYDRVLRGNEQEGFVLGERSSAYLVGDDAYHQIICLGRRLRITYQYDKQMGKVIRHMDAFIPDSTM